MIPENTKHLLTHFYDGGGNYIPAFPRFNNPFGDMCPAYISTNEDIDHAIKTYTNPKGKHVLTVAGSGDQPLTYKQYDPAHIDTFDVSFASKALMDIKSELIRNMPTYNEYHNAVKYLYKNKNVLKLIQNNPAFSGIQDALPPDTVEFLNCAKGCKIFSYGAPTCIFFGNTYGKLHQEITQPFNFTLSDCFDLPKKLTKKYDEVYLSNIMQYNCEPDKMLTFLHEMQPFLNTGAEILFYITPYFTGHEKRILYDIKEKTSDWLSVRIDQFSNIQHTCVIRVR